MPRSVAKATWGLTAGLVPPSAGLRMAAATTVQIHPWGQTLVDFFCFLEFALASEEILILMPGQIGKGIAGVCGTGAHAGIWLRATGLAPCEDTLAP